MAVFQTNQFALIPSASFLCLLSSKPKALASNLELIAEDFDTFRQLTASVVQIGAALSSLTKRAKKKGAAEVESENEQDD